MAVDTRDERFSLMGLFLPLGRVLPNPTGAISAADRMQFAYSYAGPAFTVDTGGGAGSGLMGLMTQRRRRRGFIVLGLLLCLVA
jgi:hypothetical protein